MIDLILDWKKRRDIRYAVVDAVRSVRNRFRHPARPPARAGLYPELGAGAPGARLIPLPAGQSFDLGVRMVGEAALVRQFPAAERVSFSPSFVGEIEHGHFIGLKGDVFSDEGVVFTDVNPQYGVHRNRHRLTWTGRIPAAQDAGQGTVAVLGCTTPKNLYHWMFESFGRLDLLEAAGVRADKIYMPATSAWQLELLRHCGFPMERLVPLTSGHFRAKRLVFTSMPGDDSSRVYSSIKSLETFRAVSDRIRRGFQVEFSAAPELNLYIARRGGRKILNEDELIRALGRIGHWQVVYMEDLSFAQKRELFGRARRILGLYGAAFSNMMFIHPAATIVELLSPSFAGYDYCAMTRALGLSHRYLACESPGLGRWQKRNPSLDVVIPAGSLARVEEAFQVA